MKKNLLIAGIAALLLSTTVSYADTDNLEQSLPKKPTCTCDCHKKQPPRMQKPNFDERLKLTDEQKKQAKEIRMKGHEKIKPVMEQIKTKHEEIKKVANSDISKAKKEKQIKALKQDIQKLKQQARTIRNENTKEFEAILTDEQKAEFTKIKEEAKAKYAEMKKRQHPPKKHNFGPRPGFGAHPVMPLEK